MNETICSQTGHNFMVTKMSSRRQVTADTEVIFCTKCGETRKLEVTIKSNVGQEAS